MSADRLDEIFATVARNYEKGLGSKIAYADAGVLTDWYKNREVGSVAAVVDVADTFDEDDEGDG